MLKPFLLPGARLFKLLVYDSKRNQLRGNRFIEHVAHKFIPQNRDVEIQELKIGQFSAAAFKPRNGVISGAILYLHGGGYGICSWKTHHSLIAQLCKLTGCYVLAPDYRLAPEHPFPAALNDAHEAYMYLSTLYLPEQIAIGGDSAGGGLTMATLLNLKQRKETLPACAFAFSPWLDLSLSSDTIESLKDKDPIIDKGAVAVWAKRYLADNPSDNPLASPLFGNLEGLPPLLIHVGSNEILLGENRLFVDKAKQAQVQIEFKEFEGMVHVFQFLHGFLNQAQQSVQQTADWIKSHVKSIK